jgi:hypothetical protein
LNAYRTLLDKYNRMDYEIKLFTMSPDAGFNFRNGTKTPILQIIKAPEIDPKEILDHACKMTNELERYIDTGAIPPKCDEVWPRKVKGKTIPVRCVQYCSYRDVCPHYNPKEETSLSGMGW